MVFTDFHRERVGHDERERPSLVERAVTELLDVLVEVGRHAGDLGLTQRVDPERLDELAYSPRVVPPLPCRYPSGEVCQLS